MGGARTTVDGAATAGLVVGSREFYSVGREVPFIGVAGPSVGVSKSVATGPFLLSACPCRGSFLSLSEGWLAKGSAEYEGRAPGLIEMGGVFLED